MKICMEDITMCIYKAYFVFANICTVTFLGASFGLLVSEFLLKGM